MMRVLNTFQQTKPSGGRTARGVAVLAAALGVGVLTAACQVPQTSRDAGATVAADAKEGAATAQVAGRTAAGTAAAELAGGSAAQTAAAAGDAAATQVREVEVKLGVNNSFSSDIEISRSDINKALDGLVGAAPQLDTTALRDTTREIEDELSQADDATPDPQRLQDLADKLAGQVEELKAQAPDADFTDLDQALTDLRASLEQR